MRQAHPHHDLADLHRVIIPDLRQINGKDVNAAIKHQPEDETHKRHAGKAAPQKQPKIDERLLVPQFDRDEGRNEDRGKHRQVLNHRVAEPLLALAFLEHGDQRAEPDAHADDAEPVAAA